MIVKEIKVGSEKEENTETVIRNLTFYYTTEKSYQKLRSKDLLYEDFQNKVNSNNEKIWNKLEVDSTNKLIIPNEKFSPVLIVAVGKVPERMTFKMHITMVFPGSKAGYYISNSLSQGEQEVNTHTGIISRALEGQVWIDTNMNGIRGLTEKEKVSDGAGRCGQDVEGWCVRCLVAAWRKRLLLRRTAAPRIRKRLYLFSLRSRRL